jgi:hypothetical protein
VASVLGSVRSRELSSGSARSITGDPEIPAEGQVLPDVDVPVPGHAGPDDCCMHARSAAGRDVPSGRSHRMMSYGRLTSCPELID